MNIPTYNNKNMIRPALRWLNDQWHQLHFSLEMGFAMDGSGECGPFIRKGHDRALAGLKLEFEAKFNMDTDFLIRWIENSMEKCNTKHSYATYQTLEYYRGQLHEMKEALEENLQVFN